MMRAFAPLSPRGEAPLCREQAARAKATPHRRCAFTSYVRLSGSAFARPVVGEGDELVLKGSAPLHPPGRPRAL